MDWLNYHHLYYFWVTAREGSVARAAEELSVSQPTVSLQIKELSQAFGKRLFDRAGRGLVLSEAGRVVYGYASEIFALGRQLMDAMELQPAGAPTRLAVGVADAIPKTVVRMLLEPATRLSQPVRLICREAKVEQLLTDLAAYRTDVLLSDVPVGPNIQVRAFSHLLGECGVSFFAVPDAARKLARGFPKSLSGAPLLMPADNTALRRALDVWFTARRIHPTVALECEDAAMLNNFGEAGLGAFPAPSIVESEICRQYGVRVVGRTASVRQRFFAITVEQKLKHPAVKAICEAARRELFQS